MRARPRALTALAGDCRGGSALILALALSALVGMAGLGAEAAGWYSTKRAMQGAADAAAFTAAIAKAAGATPTSYSSHARSIAATYHFVDGAAGVAVAVNSPPLTGAYATTADAVEVIITQPQPALLSAIFLDSGPTIAARSVALSHMSGSGCVLALDRGDVVDFTESGNTTLNLNGCSIYINSSNSSALTMSGSATINADAAYISGGIRLSGGARLNTGDGSFTGVEPISDPYANVPVPAYSGCDQTGFSLSGGASRTLTASGVYVFCNGLSLSGGASLTLNPGIYVIDRGVFTMSGGSSLNAGGGVTLVLTSSTGNSYATASISGGSVLTVAAPNSGPTAGIAIFQDRNAPSSGSDSLSGGSAQNIVGAIYFPNQPVAFSGGSGVSGTGCTQLIALRLTFTGNSNFATDCGSVGTRTIGAAAGQLVE